MSQDTPEPTYVRAGWREWVSLPGLEIPWIKAKLDTGARTSSLHAFHPEEGVVGGERRVRFTVHPWQGAEVDGVDVECAVLGDREVRSSSGHVEERLVVALGIGLLGTALDAEVTLSRRDEMGFRMLVGREALRQGFLVDAGASYLGGRPPLAVRRRNRGR